MQHLPFKRLICLAAAGFSILAMHTAIAGNQSSQTTISGSSIKWDDANGRLALLESVPKWNDDVIKSLFNAYLHPDNYKLPTPATSQQYNVQFINAFWGPLNNPFNKSPRPAKAFLIFDQASTSNSGQSETFVMAPLVKNLADGNYYIFDKSQTQPLLLNDWVSSMRNAHGTQTSVRFNICNGYGNAPADSCISKGYREEASDSQQLSLKALRSSMAAQNDLYSARRGSNEDWKTKVNKNKKLAVNAGSSIYDSSISWKDEAARKTLLNSVVAWPDYKTIKENFEKIRDIRYFNDPEYSDFQRRISWLYPDDGCWTRATAVIRDLFGPFNNINNNSPRPSKVFAFGNLCANTSNSPDGKVQWWYHTAPIVRDAETNQTYVLDPSINPYTPITMEKWAEEIASNSKACAGSASTLEIFNICNGYGTGPYDNCQTIYPSETKSMLMQSGYQSDERYRQEQLGRDANAVLGDTPPWLN